MDPNAVAPARKRGRPALPESQSKRLKEWRKESRRLRTDKEVEIVVLSEGENEEEQESDEEDPFQ